MCCACRGTQNSHPISLHPGEYRGTSKLSGNPWDKLASHQEGCSMIETQFLRRDPEFQQCLSPSREHKVPANCQEIPSRDKSRRVWWYSWPPCATETQINYGSIGSLAHKLNFLFLWTHVKKRLKIPVSI